MNNKMNTLLLYDENISSKANLKLQVCLKGEIYKLNINNISVDVENNKLDNSAVNFLNNEFTIKVKLNSLNKNVKKVKNGEELQKALDDKDTHTILLSGGVYSLKKQNIHISKNKKTIIGNKNAIFTNNLIVEADATLKGVKFINGNLSKQNNVNIYVKNGATLNLFDVEINNVCSKFSRGIVLQDCSKSKINIRNSTILNTNIGMEINSGNILGKMINNKFNNVDIGICNINKGTIIENLECIRNNLFNTNKEAISFSTGVNIKRGKNINLITNGVKFARILCLNNHYALIRGYEVFNGIETSCYNVKNNEELTNALSICKKGAIILMSKGKYYGNIVIKKEIALIGEDIENTIIMPKENYTASSPQYGLQISSSNLLIKNLSIDGSGNPKLHKDKCHFRDGIHYLYKLSNNNKFKNIHIRNVLRRGISIWPEFTTNTCILNCIIENIKNKQCIFFNGSGIIKNCTLRNSSIGIECSNIPQNKLLRITKNIISNNKRALILPPNNSHSIKFKNNTFK